jgi:predicted pyridoxine 5'-phosphate oxidase superfamily flavin-nucleotide-binding protein
MLQIPKEVKDLLEKSIIAFGTCDKLMRPNVIAITSHRMVGPNQILITDNFFSKTFKNLLDNSQVSLSFWDEDGKNAYQLKGNAQYMTSGDWKKRVDNDPDNANFAHKGAVLVNITEIWDLASPKLICSQN